MHPRLVVPVMFFAAGIGLIGLAVAQGDADVSLFLVFPVFSGSSATFVLGTAFILLSFVSGFILLAMGQAEAAGMDLQRTVEGVGGAGRQSRTRYGGVVLVGPVPIAFGSDQKIALAMLVVGIVVAVALLGVLLLLS
jgi:uncharacterized protein (TIGR00304 family)